MTQPNIENVNVASFDAMPSPEEIHARIPASDAAERTVMAGREALRNILDRKDHRLFVVVGPCSIHDPVAALDYAARLKALSDEVADTLLIVMRVYFEKPRTTIGWKVNGTCVNGTGKLICAAAAVAYGLISAKWILGLPQGNERMQQIAAAIQEGAQAYLYRQYQAIALVGVIPDGAFGLTGNNLRIGVLVFIIGFFNWPYIGRIVRGQTLTLKEREFVEAARSLGAGSTHIVFREILPNLVTPILVYSTLLIPTNILFEAALSFLGVGINPPMATWGGMLENALRFYTTSPHFVIIPGLAIFITVLAFNLFGDGLRDAFDPRSSD